MEAFEAQHPRLSSGIPTEVIPHNIPADVWQPTRNGYH